MKPAHQAAEGARVSVWALVRNGEYAGRYMSTRSRSGMVTGTLTLFETKEQKFSTDTARGSHCPDSDLLADILRGWGFPEAAREADKGQVQRAAEMMGFNCWQVL